LRTVSPFNEDTSGLLKDNRKDKEKIINKSSSEDLVLSNISIKEGITTTSDNPSLAEVKAIAAEDYWAVFESR
jgi:hypothetical protein